MDPSASPSAPETSPTERPPEPQQTTPEPVVPDPDPQPVPDPGRPDPGGPTPLPDPDQPMPVPDPGQPEPLPNPTPLPGPTAAQDSAGATGQDDPHEARTDADEESREARSGSEDMLVVLPGPVSQVHVLHGRDASGSAGRRFAERNT